MAILLAPALAFFLQHGKTVDVNIPRAKQPTVDEIEMTFDGDVKHAIHPISITPNPTGPMAIVFVMIGSEIMIGNEEIETDPNKQYQGILKNFEAAIDKVDLATRMPSDSEVGIVTYSTGAKVRMPLSPVAQLHGSSFGTQKEYFGQTGSDLGAGMEAGIAELAHAGERTKVMVLLDQSDEQPPEAAKQRMKDLLHRAEAMHIAIAEIVYKSDPEWVLLPSAKPVNSIEGIVSEMAVIIDVYKQSYRATFDLAKVPVWDKKPHKLAVSVDGYETTSTEMNLNLYTASARWWTSIWFRIAFAVAILILCGVVALRLMAARRIAKA